MWCPFFFILFSSSEKFPDSCWLTLSLVFNPASSAVNCRVANSPSVWCFTTLMKFPILPSSNSCDSSNSSELLTFPIPQFLYCSWFLLYCDSTADLTYRPFTSISSSPGTKLLKSACVVCNNHVITVLARTNGVNESKLTAPKPEIA